MSNKTNEALDNEQAFEQLMDTIKEVSKGVHRDAGTRFETLTKDWLTKDSTYQDLFTKVETYKEWAESHPELVVTAKDTGIDLVATLAEDPSNVCGDSVQVLRQGRHGLQSRHRFLRGRLQPPLLHSTLHHRHQ